MKQIFARFVFATQSRGILIADRYENISIVVSRKPESAVRGIISFVRGSPVLGAYGARRGSQPRRYNYKRYYWCSIDVVVMRASVPRYILSYVHNREVTADWPLARAGVAGRAASHTPQVTQARRRQAHSATAATRAQQPSQRTETERSPRRTQTTTGTRDSKRETACA